MVNMGGLDTSHTLVIANRERLHIQNGFCKCTWDEISDIVVTRTVLTFVFNSSELETGLSVFIRPHVRPFRYIAVVGPFPRLFTFASENPTLASAAMYSRGHIALGNLCRVLCSAHIPESGSVYASISEATACNTLADEDDDVDELLEDGGVCCENVLLL